MGVPERIRRWLACTFLTASVILAFPFYERKEKNEKEKKQSTKKTPNRI
jgi:hypothetical protein